MIVSRSVAQQMAEEAAEKSVHEARMQRAQNVLCLKKQFEELRLTHVLYELKSRFPHVNDFYGLPDLPDLEEILRQKLDDARPPAVSNAVKQPPHYQLENGIEVKDVVGHLPCWPAQAVQYILRAPHKGREAEDLRKAREVLAFELERLGYEVDP